MLIDLSVPLNEQTPVYPGDAQTTINTGGILEQNGYRDHVVCVGTHVGTHMDAPSHMIEGGKNLDEFPLETFSGRGVYIKINTAFDIDAIKAVDINEGNIVVFHTGMSDKYHEPAYFEAYPTITEEVARYLVEKGVKIVGVDMCSPDKPPFPVHKILLGAGVLIIENLTNLGQLADKTFAIHAFPVKLQVDGAPVRVVADVM